MTPEEWAGIVERDDAPERLLWRDPADMRCSFEQAAADRRALIALVEEMREAAQARYDDLRWCSKDDNCHDLADGAALVLSDLSALLPPKP